MPLTTPRPASDFSYDAGRDTGWQREVYARALSGDARAYADILAAYRGRFLRYATRMLQDRDAAEDVTQEAFVRAFRALPQCTAPESLEAWMFSILANRCRTWIEKQARRRRLHARFTDERVGEPIVHPDVVGTGMTMREVEHAMNVLSAEQREAFLLRHVEEMGYEEMARITGTGVSALKMRVSRARDLLRAKLAEDE